MGEQQIRYRLQTWYGQPWVGAVDPGPARGSAKVFDTVEEALAEKRRIKATAPWESLTIEVVES